MNSNFDFVTIPLIYDAKTHKLYSSVDKDKQTAALNHHVLNVLSFDKETLSQSAHKANEMKKLNGEALEIECETQRGKKRALIDTHTLREWFPDDPDLDTLKARLSRTIFKISSSLEAEHVPSTLAVGLPLSTSEILKFAKDYSDCGSLTAAVSSFAADVEDTVSNRLPHRFAAETTGLRPSQLSITMNAPGLTTGASGSPVFLVHNKDTNELRCVVKVMDEFDCADEVNALRLMKAAGPANCNFPELLGIGKYQAQKNWKRVFVAQSPAPGARLDERISQLKGLEGDRRSLMMEELKQAMQQAAKALAGLHTVQLPAFKSPDDETLQGMSRLTKRMANDQAQRFGFPERIPRLSDRFSHWSDKIEFASRGCFAHGDFHPGNIFAQESAVTLIDNAAVCESIRDDKMMIGVAGKDAALFLLWLPIVSGDALAAEELEELQGAFLVTYLSAREGTDRDALKEEIGYLQACKALDLIQQLSLIIPNPTHPWYIALGEARLKQILNYLIDVLERLVP